MVVVHEPKSNFFFEREFLIGSLIAKFDPELALTLPTIQDVFRVKETSNKLKTKSQKIQFLKQLSENLRDLPYDTQQLQKVMDFLRTKAQEYKIPPPEPITVTVATNLMTFEHPDCFCKDCSSLAPMRSTNSLVHPAKLVEHLRPVFSLLNLPELQKLLPQLTSVSCRHAKNTLASRMITLALQYCTSVSEMNLSGEKMLVFKYHFNEATIKILFDNSQLHFMTKSAITLAAGEVHEINVSFLSNLQLLPEITSELHEDLALAPDVLYNPQLCLEKINIANCSDHQILIKENTTLISFTFPPRKSWEFSAK